MESRGAAMTLKYEKEKKKIATDDAAFSLCYRNRMRKVQRAKAREISQDRWEIEV
jgi:hypothetical protein